MTAEANIRIGAVGGLPLLRGNLDERRRLLSELENSGVDHLFIADHISFHNGLGMDGLINAATLAAMTDKLDVFVGVYLLALRHPVPVARQLSSLALSAPGRFTLGIGVGGEDRHEMEVCGVDPATRGRQTDHCLAALKGLLSGEPVSYDCEFFAFDDALIKPAPEPAIPMVIGGRSDAAIRRTARFGDGWLGVWCSPRRFSEATAQVAELSEDDRPFSHGLQLWAGLDHDRDQARQHIATEMQRMYQLPFEAFEKYCPYGSPRAVADFLLPYVEAGARTFNIQPCAASPQASVEMVSEVAELIKRG